MDNDVETIQRARGWRESVWPFLPDPLADNPEDWWEFGQILNWAHAKGWRLEIDHHAGDYQVSVWVVDHWGSLSEGHPDFRAAIVAAIAAAVRRTSSRSEGSGQ